MSPRVVYSVLQNVKCCMRTHTCYSYVLICKTHKLQSSCLGHRGGQREMSTRVVYCVMQNAKCCTQPTHVLFLCIYEIVDFI